MASRRRTELGVDDNINTHLSIWLCVCLLLRRLQIYGFAPCRLSLKSHEFSNCKETATECSKTREPGGNLKYKLLYNAVQTRPLHISQTARHPTWSKPVPEEMASGRTTYDSQWRWGAEVPLTLSILTDEMRLAGCVLQALCLWFVAMEARWILEWLRQTGFGLLAAGQFKSVDIQKVICTQSAFPQPLHVDTVLVLLISAKAGLDLTTVSPQTKLNLCQHDHSG